MERRKKQKPEGSIKKYHNIADTHIPEFQRQTDKPDEKFKLDFVSLDKDGPGFNPYEYQINRRIKNEKTDDGEECPKMSWEARAFFEQSLQISKQEPTWESEDKNPIMYYIPSRHLPDNVDLPKAPFEPADTYPTHNPGHRGTDSYGLGEGQKFRSTDMRQTHRSKRSEKSMPSTPFEKEEMSIQTLSRNPTKSIDKEENIDGHANRNMLFGPTGGLRTFTKSQVALNEFKKTQLGKGNKRTEIAGLQNPEPTVKQYGFRTRFILNDLFTDKAKNARGAHNKNENDGKEHFIADEFDPYKDPVFRDLDIPFGKKELNLLYK